MKIGKFSNMIKMLLVMVLLIITEQIAFSQCIDHERIRQGSPFSSYKHSRYVNTDTITYTDVYYFDANGKVDGDYGNGNYLVNDAIDIKQAATDAQKYRLKVENAIKAYAGNRFFSELHFNFTAVLYPERVEVPIDNEHRKIEVVYEKIKDDFKYVYFYDFKADSMSSCEFRFEVDRFGKIIPRFDFPPKDRYRPINKHFTYCRLINIARKAQKHIDPIGSIQLNYNVDTERFYWVILQDISDKPPGMHYFYEIQIDAADLTKVKQKRDLGEIGIPQE